MNDKERAVMDATKAYAEGAHDLLDSPSHDPNCRTCKLVHAVREWQRPRYEVCDDGDRKFPRYSVVTGNGTAVCWCLSRSAADNICLLFNDLAEKEPR